MSAATRSAVDWRFLGLLAALAAALGIPAWLALGGVPGGRAGLAIALAFSLASAALGAHWVRWAAPRRGASFVVAVLGGLAARVLAVVALAFALHVAGGPDLVVALVAVVGLHLAFALVEIVYFHRTGILE